MDNPECTLLSVVKVEDEETEMKEEPINDGEELDFGQVEDSLSPEGSSSEHDGAEFSDNVSAIVSFSESEMAQCPLSISKFDAGTRRRLRFSESDDMVLLRKVAMLNPYKCSALWKEVTEEVALTAGKNFSVRSIRDHTDLLMNTFSLRGIDACLKRTPPELWDKKKRLLQTIHSLWKRDSFPSRSTASVTAGTNKPAPDMLGVKQSRQQSRPSKTESLQSQPKPQSLPLKGSAPHLTSPALCKLTSVPLLMQQPNVPYTLHLGNAVPSVACTPLLSGSTHSTIQPQTGILKLPVSGFPSSASGSLSPSQGKLPSIHSGSALDLVMGNASSDEPMSLATNTSIASRQISTGPQMVDRCTSPMSFEDCSLKEKMLVSKHSDVQNVSLVQSVDSSTGSANSESRVVVWRSEERRRRIRRLSLMMRSRLDILKERHKSQFMLKRRELALERRKVALEERKLMLDEQKVQLEEERWQFEKKEREEKLLVLTEEREHKMAMERRQQNMIDILLELKKK